MTKVVTVTESDIALLRFNSKTLPTRKFKFRYDDEHGSAQFGGLTLRYDLLKDMLTAHGIDDVRAIIVFGSVISPRTAVIQKSTWFGGSKDCVRILKPNDIDLVVITESEHDVSRMRSVTDEYTCCCDGYREWEQYRVVKDGLDMFFLTEHQLANSPPNFVDCITRHGHLLLGRCDMVPNKLPA